MKLISLRAAAFAATALLAAPAMANAATVTVNTSPNAVTVKWATTVSATLKLYADYQTSNGLTAAAVPTLLTTGSTVGGGVCGTAGATTGNTVDFGTITPDTAGVLICTYPQAVNAAVTTNSTGGFNLTESLSAAVPAGYTLCALSNPRTGFAATNTTAAAGGAGPANCTAAANKVIPLTNAASGNLLAANDTTNGQGVNIANIGEDLALLVPQNAPANAVGNSIVLGYTLTAN